MKLQPVPAEDMPLYYEDFKPFLENVAERSGGRVELRDIIDALLKKEWQLWLVRDGDPVAAFVTRINVYPRAKACEVVAVVGENFNDWAKFEADVEEWARQNGCNIMEAYARPGWSKIMKHWKNTHNFIERRIDD